MCILLAEKIETDQGNYLDSSFMEELDIKTKKKIENFRFYPDKKRTLTGYKLLQKGLKIGKFEDSLSSIKLNEFGKPYFPKGETFFNISHSGDYVVCVVSNRNVGVDIQKKVYVSKDLIENFHREEILKFSDLPLHKRESLFFKYWTVKECYLKYLGIGLSKSLKSFYFDIDKSKIVDPANYTDEVKITHYNVDNGYYLAIAHHKSDLIYLV